jgi:hypothetical protein
VARPNSAHIKAGVLAALQADPTLAALAPGGVFAELAAPGVHVFVLVTLLDSDDTDAVFGQRGIESSLFAVKFVGLSTATQLAIAEAAAARIDELLELGALPITDYSFLECVRERRIATTARDPGDPSLSWFHYGGEYRVQVAWPDDVTVSGVQTP